MKFVAFLLVGILQAQIQAPASLQFEVASVKPNWKPPVARPPLQL